VVLFRAGKTELAEEPLKKAVAVAPKDVFALHARDRLLYGGQV